MSTFYAPPEHPRRPADFYATPPELTGGLIHGLRQMRFNPYMALETILDPCAGDGAILRVLRAYGNTHARDLHPDRYPSAIYQGEKPLDASKPLSLGRAVRACGASALITNPPYGRESMGIVSAAVSVLETTPSLEVVAILLPIQWQAAGTRVPLFRNSRFAGSITCCWRPEWIGGTGGGGKISSCWFVWARRSSPPQPVYVAKSEALSTLSATVGVSDA